MQLRESDPSAQTLSLVAGLALIEAIDIAVPGQPLILKWPNDVMLGGKKLAGILLERSGDHIAAGFGINLATAPALSDRAVASLSAQMLPQAFAPLLATSFARLLDAWRQSEPTMLVKAWLSRAHPVGTPLNIQSGPNERSSGEFDGLEADGALRLRREDGSVEIVRAGDVDL